MRGPLPKDPFQRRRRNASGPSVRVLPREGRQGAPPLLLDETYTQEVREWWERVWRSPVATAWNELDAHSLIHLARLLDIFARGDTRGLVLREIRAYEDRFGLNPAARRRLGWLMEGDDHP